MKHLITTITMITMITKIQKNHIWPHIKPHMVHDKTQNQNNYFFNYFLMMPNNSETNSEIFRHQIVPWDWFRDLFSVPNSLKNNNLNYSW